MAPPANTIILSPSGDFETKLLDDIGKQIHKIYDFNTEILPLLDGFKFAFDPRREQYHSTVILKELAALAPPHALRVLALTNVDLFIPILTHVYGEAQFGGRSCIISDHRLAEGISVTDNQELFRRRVVKEAVHELGHTFKLRHCKEQTCIMHYCRTIKDVDRKSDQFCRYCTILFEDQMKRLAVEQSASP